MTQGIVGVLKFSQNSSFWDQMTAEQHKHSHASVMKH